jgi:hypothetical protein
VDQDCDGLDLVDVDADRWAGVAYADWLAVARETAAWPEEVARAAIDCDDEEKYVWPGAPDSWYDGIDADCDGASDYDQDGDGYVPDAFAPYEPGLPSGDCDDTDRDAHPGAPDEPSDGVDADCDGADD